MKAIELSGTINEKGQLNLDECLEVTQPQRVRVIVLMSENEQQPIANYSPVKRPLKRGSAKGKVWMSDDFDQPLEDFEEYM